MLEVDKASVDVKFMTNFAYQNQMGKTISDWLK